MQTLPDDLDLVRVRQHYLGLPPVVDERAGDEYFLAFEHLHIWKVWEVWILQHSSQRGLVVRIEIQDHQIAVTLFKDLTNNAFEGSRLTDLLVSAGQIVRIQCASIEFVGF